MKRFFTYATIITLGATATLAVSPRNPEPGTTAEVRFANDGAFRDGLYLGKLAAQAGQPLRPAIGRWSTEQDRASFRAGYFYGYSEPVATRSNAADVRAE